MSMAPNPDMSPASRKLKKVTKIYNERVKFMQTYKQILFIVGSEMNEETHDFSTK